MVAPRSLAAQLEDALARVGRVLFIPRWPPIALRWNKRLRRAGRAVIDLGHGAFKGARIELSPAYFEVYPGDLAGILVHEAVHVGLALKGRPFGHTPEFRRACEAAGGLPHSRWLPGRVYRYRCPTCGAVLERRRPAARSRWCAACAAQAQARGEEPFRRERALVLVETVFQGPEPTPAPGG